MSRKNKRKTRLEKEEEAGWERGPLMSAETKKSVLIIILFALSALFILSFFDLAGALGQALKNGLNLLFGWGALIAPVVLLILGYFMLLPEKYAIGPSNYLGVFFLVLAYSGIFQFIKDAGIKETFLTSGQGGGYLGYFIYLPLQKIMGSWAAIIVLLAVLLIAVLLTFNTTLQSVAKKINVFGWFKGRISAAQEEGQEWQEENEDWQQEKTAAGTAAEEAEQVLDEPFTKKKIPAAAREAGLKAAKKSGWENLNVTFAKKSGRQVAVPLGLLDNRSTKPTAVDIRANAEVIKTTLENFGIPVEMGEVNVGPTVTQFTFKPAEGIKLARITTLQNDLALALAAHPIRLEAPIPGKSLVGVEVPNQKIAIVKLKEIIASQEFQHKRGSLKIALGEDVSGKAWVVSLASMPHLLIAGATGSGKSVCINNVIISLLYQYTPDQLKMVIVDPKKVELVNYNGIPHLLTPVITEVDKTINALRWVVKEMDERFKLLNVAGKRNIDAYNESVLINRLPYIVVIVDELADLMAVAARDVEAAIVRLAQMARAVGIYLVVATQRPSVNVITGLIKANITARIAFAVASQVDSRTILDFSGAEKLLGKGDLLFTSAEISKPRRLQGAYLSDQEIERVIDFWKQQAEPDYNDEVVESRHSVGSAAGGFESGDELLEEAKDIVIKAGKASASLLQRRLRVGYARAARLLDLLEEGGIIGPGEGAKPREILVSDTDYYHIPSETTNKYVGNDLTDNGEEEEEEKDDEEAAAQPAPTEAKEEDNLAVAQDIEEELEDKNEDR